MKLRKKVERSKFFVGLSEPYSNYLALDWSLSTMAIARLSSSGIEPIVKESKSDIKKLRAYLDSIRGKKILTIEETTSSHWLYVELKESVDKILVCDPYRNSLLKEGAKTDKIDAKKLSKLLRGVLLKEVYHSSDELYKVRKLASGYEDLVKSGVRVQNQHSALYRGLGLKYKSDRIPESERYYYYVSESQLRGIEFYKRGKKCYEQQFRELIREKEVLQYLREISGIGAIRAVELYSIVIDACRFETKYKYWSYCGLVYNKKESGGRNYGKRLPRHSRKLKGIYKSGALSAIKSHSDIRQYYEHLLQEGYGEQKARRAVARYIAKVSYAVMKTGKRYIPYSWRKETESK